MCPKYFMSPPYNAPTDSCHKEMQKETGRGKTYGPFRSPGSSTHAQIKYLSRTLRCTNVRALYVFSFG